MASRPVQREVAEAAGGAGTHPPVGARCAVCHVGNVTPAAGGARGRAEVHSCTERISAKMGGTAPQ